MRRLYEKHILSRINPYFDFDNIARSRFIVNVCNYCNLRCFSCSNLMDKPMGSNVYRDRPRETTEKHLDLFLSGIGGYRKDAWVRLTGGEPTLLEPSKITSLAKTIKLHERQVDIITNGYALMKLDPFLFDEIILDDHGVNHSRIQECVEWLEEQDYRNIRILSFVYHRDLEAQRQNNVSWGPRCRDWMKTITLWGEIVYPCCVMHSIEGMENDRTISLSLEDHGWNIHNPKLLSTIKNWRETIPNEVLRACILGCWHGGTNKKWRKIN